MLVSMTRTKKNGTIFNILGEHMNDNGSAFFHKKDKKDSTLRKIYLGFDEHRDRMKRFTKRYPGKNANDFITWYFEQKGIKPSQLSSSVFISTTRAVLKKLEDCGWDYNKSLVGDTR